MYRPKYVPFFYFILAFSINEIAAWIVNTFYPGIDSVHLDIYFLLESILLYWMFRRWKLFSLKNGIYRLLPFLYCIIWGIEYYYTSFAGFLPYFIIFYAFVTLVMSISMMNKALQSEQTNILNNPVFTICCTFLIFFIYMIIFVVFWLPQLNTDYDFKWKVFSLFNIINIISNIGHTIAVLQIKRGQEFNFT